MVFAALANAIERAMNRLNGLPPIVSPQTRLVVLGSFPGQASLAQGQYYAHPRNLFWTIVSRALALPLVDAPYAQRIEALQRRGVGLWDVYASCEREGSLDQAIRQAQPNDLRQLTQMAPNLVAVAHNGAESARSMRLTDSLGVLAWRLPSTSPANASWSFERKLSAWQSAFMQAGIISP